MFQTIAGTKSEGKTSHLLDSELGESIHVEVKVGDGLLESEAGGQVSQYKNSTDHVEIQASGDKELNEKGDNNSGKIHLAAANSILVLHSYEFEVFKVFHFCGLF